MLCRDVMKFTVEYIGPKDSARAAARRMRQANVGFLPVCDPDGRVIGTLTDRDITVRLVADGLQPDTPVADVMTREAIFCSPDADIRRAHELMGEHRKSRLLCCEDDGSLVGVISLSDIAACHDADVAATTLRQITSREARGCPRV